MILATWRFVLVVMFLFPVSSPVFATDSVDAFGPGGARDLVERWGERFVDVSFFLRVSDGSVPPGKWQAAWRERRPFRAVALQVDATSLWLPELDLDPRFIARIVVGDAEEPVRLAARWESRLGWRLTREKPTDLAPLAFVEPPERETLWAVSRDTERSWRIAPVGAPYTVIDGVVSATATAGALLVDPHGNAVGYSFDGRVVQERTDVGESAPWSASAIRGATQVSRTAMAREVNARLASSARALPSVRLQFREGATDDAWESWGLTRATGKAATEEWALGWAIDARRLVVHHPLDRNRAARLRRVRVSIDGEDIDLRFVGALRGYHAFVVEAERDLFFPYPWEESTRGLPSGRATVEVTVDHVEGARRSRAVPNRVLSSVEGYRGEREPHFALFPMRGSVHFDAAVERVVGATFEVEREDSADAWRAARVDRRGLSVARLRSLFEDLPSAIDPSRRPRALPDSARYPWLGVDTQAMTPALARFHGLELITRGGAIGRWVHGVHVGSPAAAAGIEVGDVLLSVSAENAREIELDAGEDDWDLSTWDPVDYLGWSEEDIAEARANQPPPWPNPRGALARALRPLPVDATVELRYVRGGEARSVEVTLRAAPDDYSTAPSFHFRSLGLTVKDLTPEVRAYLRLDADAPGVIVAHVEGGHPASVAKIWTYERITEVAGEPVRSAADFRARVLAAIGDASNASSLELRVERFGKSRLVRISLR